MRKLEVISRNPLDADLVSILRVRDIIKTLWPSTAKCCPQSNLEWRYSLPPCTSSWMSRAQPWVRRWYNGRDLLEIGRIMDITVRLMSLRHDHSRFALQHREATPIGDSVAWWESHRSNVHCWTSPCGWTPAPH